MDMLLNSSNNLHPHQSIPICCLLAVIGGIFEVAATAVTAVYAPKTTTSTSSTEAEDNNNNNHRHHHVDDDDRHVEEDANRSLHLYREDVEATTTAFSLLAEGDTTTPVTNNNRSGQYWWQYFDAQYWLAVGGNLTLQLIGCTLSHLVATWYGPISIVVPFFYASTLVTNRLVFGSTKKKNQRLTSSLETEAESEDDDRFLRSGTYVIVIATLLLPQVGPAIQENQDMHQLLFHNMPALLWFGILLVAMSISTVGLVYLQLKKKKKKTTTTTDPTTTATSLATTEDGNSADTRDRIVTKYPFLSSPSAQTVLLLVARATSIALNLTVSRGFVCLRPSASDDGNNSQPQHRLFLIGLLIGLKLISGAVYTGAVVVQSTAVNQTTFVPLNTSTIICINAITGIIIWQDYKVITSWFGYGCVFVLLGLGCDLLLSNQQEQQQQQQQSSQAPQQQVQQQQDSDNAPLQQQQQQLQQQQDCDDATTALTSLVTTTASSSSSLASSSAPSSPSSSLFFSGIIHKADTNNNNNNNNNKKSHLARRDHEDDNCGTSELEQPLL